MNFVAQGSEPDIERAATDIIKRFQSGGFGRVTLSRPSMILPGCLRNPDSAWRMR